jgi:hypothetical protein
MTALMINLVWHHVTRILDLLEQSALILTSVVRVLTTAPTTAPTLLAATSVSVTVVTLWTMMATHAMIIMNVSLETTLATSMPLAVILMVAMNATACLALWEMVSSVQMLMSVMIPA